MNKLRDEGALKPIGLALTAVVSGLGAAHAMTPAVVVSSAEATRDAAEEETYAPFSSAAVEPFAEPSSTPSQPDLFER